VTSGGERLGAENPAYGGFDKKKAYFEREGKKNKLLSKVSEDRDCLSAISHVCEIVQEEGEDSAWGSGGEITVGADQSAKENGVKPT